LPEQSYEKKKDPSRGGGPLIHKLCRRGKVSLTERDHPPPGKKGIKGRYPLLAVMTERERKNSINRPYLDGKLSLLEIDLLRPLA